MYTLIDLVGLLSAVVLAVPAVVLPGYVLAWGLDVFGARHKSAQNLLITALICAFAALPVLSNLVAQVFGITVLAGITLVCAGAGGVLAWRAGRPRVSPGLLLAGLAWLAFTGFMHVDFDTAAGTWPSFVVSDLVKHAATINGLSLSNAAPPPDPFFLRESAAGYYYFFYLAGAVIDRLGHGLADARMIFAALVFWAGLAAAGFAVMLAERTGLTRGLAGWGCLLPAGLMAISSVQLVILAIAAAATGRWMAQTTWWTDGTSASPFAVSLIWVPHHVMAAVAIFVAVLALARQAERPVAEQRWPAAIGVAGLCFGSAAGLSVWVTLAGGAGVAAWSGLLACERRWRVVWAIAVAGGLALILAAPYLSSVLHNRAPGPLPVRFQVVDFKFTELAFAPGWQENLARLIVLPLNYFVQFGFFMIASAVFWLNPALRRHFSGEAARATTVLAVCGLLVGTFVAANIRNNDLGYRAPLFLQFAMLGWSAVVVRELAGRWRAGVPSMANRAVVALVVTGLLGLAGTAYDAVSARVGGELARLVPSTRPAVFGDLRRVYLWANSELPPQAVLQHNADSKLRFAYGLYGRHRVAVSDILNSIIFGAPEDVAAQRLEQLKPVFDGRASARDAAARLEALGVDYVVVSNGDPVWDMPASWVWRSWPVLALKQARVIRVKDIGAMKHGAIVE